MAGRGHGCDWENGWGVNSRGQKAKSMQIPRDEIARSQHLEKHVHEILSKSSPQLQWLLTTQEKGKLSLGIRSNLTVPLSPQYAIFNSSKSGRPPRGSIHGETNISSHNQNEKKHNLYEKPSPSTTFLARL